MMPELYDFPADDDDYERFPAGNLKVTCNICAVPIGVWVMGKIYFDEEGSQLLVMRPDYSDFYAHAWTHEGEGN